MKEKIKLEIKEKDGISKYEILKNKDNNVGENISRDKHENSNKTFVNEIIQKEKDLSINVSDGEAEDSGMICFYDGDISMNEGESVIEAWAF